MLFKYFFGKYDQIRSFLRIWSHLLKKSLMKNFIFAEVIDKGNSEIFATLSNAICITYVVEIFNCNYFFTNQTVKFSRYTVFYLFSKFLHMNWIRVYAGSYPFTTYVIFSWKLIFLTPRTHTHVCVSGGKKCKFFKKKYVSTKWIIPKSCPFAATQQTFVLVKTFWRRVDDVFRLRLQKTSSRRLHQDKYIRHLQKMSSRRFQDVFQKHP